MSGNLVLIALALLVGTWVMWPLFRARTVGFEFSEEDTPLGRLATRKEVLLGNISDLDFEFAMGKLSEEDYRDLRESLKRQTLKIMEQMDVLLDGPSATATAPQKTSSSEKCTGCGGTVPSEARFCPHCGSSLS